jgi:transcriptional regulator with XRE-family HTH domain
MRATSSRPGPDNLGNYPAIEYARSSSARKLTRERTRVRLTERELARLAGVRVETFRRIEAGRHTTSAATLAKLERALHGASRSKGGSRTGKSAKQRRGAS